MGSSRGKNRGFTLIELVAVVAIIGVLTALVTASVSSAPAAEARRCATELDALLSRCKVEAMSRAGTVSLTVDVENGDIRGNLLWKNGDTEYELADDLLGSGLAITPDSFTLSFDRATGAISFPEGQTRITAITVSGGGRSYTVTLVPSTGAHYMEGAANG